MVRDINLTEDLGSIYVDADIYPEAAKLLNDKTRFWLVKPTASLTGVPDWMRSSQVTTSRFNPEMVKSLRQHSMR
ncbi:paraquat-inducible protein B [Vibrio sp. JCM 19053]|nr:paraquat-inducible protein B [Vibrio sp. JCM 19053]